MVSAASKRAIFPVGFCSVVMPSAWSSSSLKPRDLQRERKKKPKARAERAREERSEASDSINSGSRLGALSALSAALNLNSTLSLCPD